MVPVFAIFKGNLKAGDVGDWLRLGLWMFQVEVNKLAGSDYLNEVHSQIERG